jgi:hypothetical protein
MPVPGDGTPLSGTLPEENQQGRLVMLDHAQYVRFRQGHGWRSVYARYNPANNATEEEDRDVLIVYQNGEETAAHCQIGLGNVDNPNVVENILARQNHWREVNDKAEHARLHSASRGLKGSTSRRPK